MAPLLIHYIEGIVLLHLHSDPLIKTHKANMEAFSGGAGREGVGYLWLYVPLVCLCTGGSQ